MDVGGGVDGAHYHHLSWLSCLIMVPLTHPFPSSWFVAWALKLLAVDLQILLVIIFGVWCGPACCTYTMNMQLTMGVLKTCIFQGMLARDSNLWARAFTEDFASEISHIPNITAPSREIFNRIGTQTNQLWGWSILFILLHFIKIMLAATQIWRIVSVFTLFQCGLVVVYYNQPHI